MTEVQRWPETVETLLHNDPDCLHLNITQAKSVLLFREAINGVTDIMLTFLQCSPTRKIRWPIGSRCHLTAARTTLHVFMWSCDELSTCPGGPACRERLQQTPREKRKLKKKVLMSNILAVSPVMPQCHLRVHRWLQQHQPVGQRKTTFLHVDNVHNHHYSCKGLSVREL